MATMIHEANRGAAPARAALAAGAMRRSGRVLQALAVLGGAAWLAACSPEVGSHALSAMRREERGRDAQRPQPQLFYRHGRLIADSAWCSSPEVGSERWCEAMKDKPKGEWTANEAASYTKHCLL